MQSKSSAAACSVRTAAPTTTVQSKSNAAVVQATNDTSLVSKCSAMSLGYLPGHEWLAAFKHCFTKRGARRAPQINRGYYARVRCIERVVRNFAALPLDQPRQILCLGVRFFSFSVSLGCFNLFYFISLLLLFYEIIL